MNLSSCRVVIDKFAPQIGRSFRSMRDAKMFRQPIQTEYGFSLAGDPTILGENFESEEKRVFLESLDTHDIVLDIGANVGFYACLAASRGKHTLAFEPSPRNLSFLCKNLWENKFSNVEVFPLGLAGKSGLECIYGFGTSASFMPGWDHASQARFSLVPLTTLDTIAACRFKNKRLFVKMDVEGFELNVLEGATETLDLNPKPTWMVEVHLNHPCIPGGFNRRFSEVFEIFWKHGYQCTKPDRARTPVAQADVSRWIGNGFVDLGTRDFLFS